MKREERSIAVFEWERNRVDPRVYVETGISTGQAGIENKSLMCW